MTNPYQSPTTESTLPRLPITDELVRQLIDGTETETFAFYDVSDCQFYGCKHRRKLTDSLAADAESAGCFPIVYQSVHWWCLVFMPIRPLAVYAMIPCKDCDDPDGDAVQFRAIRVPWDSNQVALHYIVMFVPLLMLVCGVWWQW